MNNRFVSLTRIIRHTGGIAVACLCLAQLSFADDAYSHDSSQKINGQNWMSYLQDSNLLTRLSIPGTHDTMSNGPGGDAVQTQGMSLATQLNSGIRVVDIRCRHFQNNFVIHHGQVYLNANFDDVLGAVTSFLHSNPGETVLMRVSEEYDASGNTRSFEATFADYVQRYKSYFWNPVEGDMVTIHPTLGQVRGKIVVLQDFQAASFWGLRYSGLIAQDNYVLNTNWDLYTKWSSVKQAMVAANNDSQLNGYINYLSGSTGSFPYFVASGHSDPSTNGPRLWTGLTTDSFFGTNSGTYPDFPRLDCVDFLVTTVCSIYFEGTNRLTTNYLNDANNHGFYPRVGIIMADFPGPNLIEAVINQNSSLTFDTSWSRGQPCLQRGQGVTLAKNGWQRLEWQGDGNLVIYDWKGPRWATGTNSSTTSLMCFQNDGNLVIYDPVKKGGVAWASNTYNVGTTLKLQGDCNLVIYDSAGKPHWASGTNPCKR